MQWLSVIMLQLAGKLITQDKPVLIDGMVFQTHITKWHSAHDWSQHEPRQACSLFCRAAQCVNFTNLQVSNMLHHNQPGAS